LADKIGLNFLQMLLSSLPKIPLFLGVQANSNGVRISARLCCAVTETSHKPKARKKLPKNGPSLQHFLKNAWGDEVKPTARKPELKKTPFESHPYLTQEMIRGDGLKGKMG
jgi:hypothetical protein